DPVNPRGSELDARFAPLPLEIGEKYLLRVHLLAKLEVARQRHADRVDVDRLGAREIHDRRERFARLEDPEVEAGLLRLDACGETRHAAAHDREIQRVSRVAYRAKVRLLEYREDRARPRIRGELQQWDSRQVADDADARDRRGSVGSDLGEL